MATRATLLEQIDACDKVLYSAPPGRPDMDHEAALTQSLVLSLRRAKLIPTEVAVVQARISSSLFVEEIWSGKPCVLAFFERDICIEIGRKREREREIERERERERKKQKQH